MLWKLWRRFVQLFCQAAYYRFINDAKNGAKITHLTAVKAGWVGAASPGQQGCVERHSVELPRQQLQSEAKRDIFSPKLCSYLIRMRDKDCTKLTESMNKALQLISCAESASFIACICLLLTWERSLKRHYEFLLIYIA